MRNAQMSPCTSLLAELMLPDGAHLRTEDWTVFYLNQTAATAVKSELRSDAVGQSETSESKGKDLLYTMSLVRTKHGSAFKRSALCPPMPDCRLTWLRCAVGLSSKPWQSVANILTSRSLR